MKLLIAVVQAYDADRLLRAVNGAGLYATKINSLGGFLRMANATVLMAMNDDQVPQAVEIIRQTSQRRVEVKMDSAVEVAEYTDWFAAGFHEVTIGGAVVFVTSMDGIYKVWPTHIEKQVEIPA